MWAFNVADTVKAVSHWSQAQRFLPACTVSMCFHLLDLRQKKPPEPDVRNRRSLIIWSP